MRKIEQFQVSENRVVALCEDGTLWVCLYTHNTEIAIKQTPWIQLKDVPKSKVPTEPR